MELNALAGSDGQSGFEKASNWDKDWVLIRFSPNESQVPPAMDSGDWDSLGAAEWLSASTKERQLWGEK